MTNRRRTFALAAGLLIIAFAGVLALIQIAELCACEPLALPLTPTFGPISAANNPLVEKRQILLTSNRDGDWDIYLMSLGDRSVINLTDNSADDGFGSFSRSDIAGQPLQGLAG